MATGCWYIGLAAVLGLAGCDDPICPSDVFVALQTSEVTVDSDAVAPGVQASIRVRTSLAEGESVRLMLQTAAGAPLATLEQDVDRDGVAVFEGVTVVAPATRMRASIDTECGAAEDELLLGVTTSAGCELAITPPPAPSSFYAPRGVLALAADPDPETPGIDATLAVTTREGFLVEVFAVTPEGELGLGTVMADAGGIAQLAHLLPDGDHLLRATCTGPAGTFASPSTAFVVDTTPPSCAIEAPAPGATITPALDRNADISDGIQLAIVARVSGGDTEGEPASLAIAPVGGTAQAISMTAIDADGHSTGETTLTAPGGLAFQLEAQDHAGNTCAAAESYEVVFDPGCAIDVLAPTSIVTADADATAANGSQVDVALQVDPACAGRTVSSTCGGSAVVPGDGIAAVRATVCATSPCEVQTTCTFRVTSATGTTTAATATLAFDDLAPVPTVSIVNPAVACDSQVSASADVDPSIAGVQIVARVTAPGSVSRSLVVRSGATTTTFGAAADVTLTLKTGNNELEGVAVDAAGNTGRSPRCKVSLAP